MDMATTDLNRTGPTGHSLSTATATTTISTTRECSLEDMGTDTEATEGTAIGDRSNKQPIELMKIAKSWTKIIFAC